MKNEKFLSTYNAINIKNKHQNPLYLTWNKFRKNNSLSQSNKNINQAVNTKNLNHTDYYKDPFFLNSINLKNQLQILRAINSEQLKLKRNFMEENFPTIYNMTQNINYLKIHNADINDYYNRVFKMKPLFRKIKPVVDNKLNMRYAENEEQYRNIIEKEKKILLSQGKRVKNKNVSEHINIKMNEIKKRIRFMKGVMDFTYPGFVLTKIRAIDRQLKREDDIHNKLHEYHCPVEVRNLSKTKRNNDRRKYLFECFHIKTETLK